MAIDVGAACIDRPSSWGNGLTLIEGSNPANADGTIDSVCIYVANDITGAEFASFADEGSNVYSTNGDTNGSDLSASAGSNTFTSAGNDFTAFAINTGEYIGINYVGAVGIEFTSSGGTALLYVEGDNIPASSVTFNLIPSYQISLYATSAEAAGEPSFIPQIIMF